MKRAVSAVLATALLAACGSDGGDASTTAETDGGTPPTRAPDGDAAVFEAKDVGFTFEYPKGFVREKGEGVLGQVGPERGSFFNAIKVRRAADSELPFKRYLDDFRRDFARRVGEVEKREEEVGELRVGVLRFSDSAKEKGKTVEFTSTSYFFSGGGATWQIECVTDAEHEDEIDAACQAAVGSVRFRRD